MTPDQKLNAQPNGKNQWYSIVINNLQDYIHIRDIQNKVYIKENKDEFKKDSTDHYYNTYTDTIDIYKEGIELHPTHSFETPENHYENLTSEGQDVVSAIKYFCNNFPCAFVWHDGLTDDPICKFEGLHIHIICLSSEPLGLVTLFKRNVKKRLQKYGIEMKYQKIKELNNLIQYLQTPPRFLLGCNNKKLCEEFHNNRPTNTQSRQEDDSTTEEEKENEQEEPHPEEQLIRWIQKKLKTPKNPPVITTNFSNMDIPGSTKIIDSSADTITMSKSVPKIDILKALMEKYQKFTEEDLYKKIYQGKEEQDINLIRNLTMTSYTKDIFKNAIRELEMDGETSSDGNFVDTLIQNKPTLENSFSTTETADLFLRWCEEQQISSGDCMMKLYYICDKTLPKYNSFMLQGASNAGKTFWNTMLTSASNVIGQTIQSNDFTWMNCVDKELIQFAELKLNNEQLIENFKKITGGEPTIVNVKHQGGRIIQRTPVIITCNTLPWETHEGHTKTTIQNRMFYFHDLTESQVLKNVKIPPDPKFLAKVFEYIRQDISTGEEFPRLPNEQYYPLYCYKIQKFIKKLAEGDTSSEDHQEKENNNNNNQEKNTNTSHQEHPTTSQEKENHKEQDKKKPQVKRKRSTKEEHKENTTSSKKKKYPNKTTSLTIIPTEVKQFLNPNRQKVSPKDLAEMKRLKYRISSRWKDPAIHNKRDSILQAIHQFNLHPLLISQVLKEVTGKTTQELIVLQ